MAESVFVDLTQMEATNAYGRIPDEHAVAFAYPYAVKQGLSYIDVQHRGQAFSRRYTLAQVKELLKRNPELLSLGGVGKPEPTKGFIQAGGRYYPSPSYVGREHRTAGGLIQLST